jgi:hypothetical protein
MASRIVRLERLESRVDLDNPFASLTDSELLVLIGTYADTYLALLCHTIDGGSME